MLLDEGRLLLSIGDVAGSGLGAAVTMAAARQSIRSIARIDPDPVRILDATDANLQSGAAPFEEIGERHRNA